MRILAAANMRLMPHRIFHITILSGFILSVLPGATRSPLETEMVESHNRVRTRVGVPRLVWSDPLAAHARQWANHLIETGAFEHSHAAGLGENIYEITGARATPEQVVNSWASELRDYDYRTNRCRGVCGHYTQIVWRDTKEVGCGVAAGGDREVWVCNYSPPGNYVGERPY
jgi:pathogenesis-related protein 1